MFIKDFFTKKTNTRIFSNPNSVLTLNFDHSNVVGNRNETRAKGIRFI